MITNTSDVSVLWVEQATLFKGMSITSHKHDFFHLSYLVKAIDEGSENGPCASSRDGKNNQMLIIPPGRVHFANNVTETAVYWSFKLIVWDQELRCAMLHLPQSVELDAVLINLLENIVLDVASQSINPQTLDSAFSFFLRLMLDKLKTNANAITDAEQQRTESIKEYIEHNYNEDVSLDSIARHIGFSKSYTSVLFRQEHGITISDYINRVRIKKACELISYSSMAIPDVCKACGFNDYHNFGRMFKRLMGVSPGKYRQSLGDAAIVCDQSQLTYHYTTPTFTYAADAQKLMTWETVAEYIAQKTLSSS